MSSIGPYDPQFDDDEDAQLVDQQSIEDIIEKAQDLLRPIGLSFKPEEVQVAIQNGRTYMIFPTVVRPSAKKKLTEDRETREALNKMLADQHDAEIAQQADKIRQMASDPERLIQEFFGEAQEESSDEECPKGGQHERHPDGFCMKCMEGFDS